MALGRQGAVQRELLIGWHEVPSAPGHIFYDRLNAVLDQAGFDREVEALCAPQYAAKAGRPSIPPGRYFRMLLVGYFESLDSERGIAWRCADSLSLRQFLQLGAREAVPDHSMLSRTRARLPLEVHDAVFALVLGLLAEHGLVKGRRVGVDASTMEANAAMRSIVRRARRAVYANRARLLSGVARVALRLRAVLCERAFAHVLERGGMRRTWLRGRDNVAKRYLVQVAGHNLGLLMRALFGAGTPKAAADLHLFWLAAGDRLLLLLLCPRTGPAAIGSALPAAFALVTITPDNGALSMGC